MIIKYNRPSRFESSPEGTVVKVMLDNDTRVKHTKDKYEYYVQISEYLDDPNWVTWGYFLGLILRDKVLDEEFVSKCLDVFKAKNLKNSSPKGSEKLKKNIVELINKMNL